ncbi:MAG TPA: vitamin K epoxide reductase family protein [Vicinamibacterales bacterium]|nr:vitamin K epoxide reductase family protein [Vicinamibacterales bacterium]
MSARSRWLILVLALVGLGFASASTWVHYKLLTDASYTSPCDINATFNCSQVYLSPYGSIGGVPVAIGGMFWFGLVALVAAFATTGKASPAGTYLFLLGTVGLAVILYMAFRSYQLQTACVLCLGTYASVAAIFIVSGSASSVPMTQIPARLAGDIAAALRRPLVTLFALFLIAGTVGMAATFPKEGTRPQPQSAAPTAQATQDFTTAWNAQPRVDLGIPADGAKVVIVKFNDYQCPGCRETHEWYKPVLAKFQQSNPGAVKYILKDWPWSTNCNFNAGRTLHPAACEAAAAVRMAREQGKAKEVEMEEWLYGNQLANPAAVKSAVQKILGITDFDRRYPQKVADIRRDIADGGALRIQSTPTLFINGVRIEALMPPQYFELAIQIELNKK